MNILSPYELNELAKTVEDNPPAQSLLSFPMRLETIKANPAVPDIHQGDTETLELILMLVNLFTPILFRRFSKPKTPL